MTSRNIYKFSLQLLSILLLKGSTYLITIYIYYTSKDDTATFFLMNSVASFLGPLLLFGNGALITKNVVKEDSDAERKISDPILNFITALGFFSFLLSLLLPSVILNTITLAASWGIFSIYIARARAFDGFETIIVSFFKAALFISSILILGYTSFPKLIFVLLLIFLIIKGEISLKYLSLKYLNGIIKSSQHLTLHSLSRWIMNSSDKLILATLQNPIVNDYTFIYTIGSGVSLFANAVSNYIPRLIYSGEKRRNVALQELMILSIGFFANLILGFIYLTYNSNSLEMKASFVFICIALTINGLTVSWVSQKIQLDKLNDLAQYGIIVSILSIILFSLAGYLSENIVYISLINIVIYTLYYCLLKYGKVRRSV